MLSADTAIGLEPALNARQAAGSRRLLVRVRAKQHIAVQFHAQTIQNLEREAARSDSTLHVPDAAAYQQTVADLGSERIDTPILDRTCRDGVDVTVEEKATARRPAGETSDQLRAADEVEIVGDESVSLAGGLGLPKVDLCADATKAVCQVALQRLFVPCRIANGSSRRVERHELLYERDQLVCAAASL
jgi:hypothetical protein